MNGLLLVDKPVGPSSHQVIARIRKALHQRRVGHAGTLDPLASGLLVVGIGSATRLLTFLVGLDKTYEATIRLGVGTTTDDAQGEVVATPGCPPDAAIAEQLSCFRGPLRQRPSSVSAIKVDGRRAYQRVRAGEDVELSERDVTVHDLELVAVRPGASADGLSVVDVDVVMSVSSGTYVRAIARDLGVALSTAGHLIALRRTHVGPFDVATAADLDQIDGGTVLLELGAVAAQVLPTFPVADEDVVAIANGSRLPCPGAYDTPTALVTGSGRLLSVSQADDGRWRHLMVVPASS